MGWRAVAPEIDWRIPGWLRAKQTLGRRLTGLVLLLGTGALAMGCAAGTAIPGQSPSVTISRLSAEPIGLRTAPGVELLAAYALSGSDPRFGGFSAIETDGRTLWLLSDRATLWRAALDLDGTTGALMALDWQVGEVVGDALDRRPLDSEALALAQDGTLFAAFEHDQSLRRLERLPAGEWSTERLHPGRLIEGAPRNRGLEALARLADGSLVALSEGARLAPNVAEGARLTRGAVTPFGYAISPGFDPVGAATKDGHLYVLERSLSVLGGWQSRLTRSAVPASGEWGTLEAEELIRIDAGPLAENYEGVAILEHGVEAASILLIADDNQSALQRTLLLVFSYAG